MIYPQQEWSLIEAESGGWSTEGLLRAWARAEEMDTTAVMVVQGGVVVGQWGDVAVCSNTHSCRKSFLSAMFGRLVEEGLVRLDATLDELGIDDNAPSLTSIEKNATVEQLLQARSGVYHPCLYETEKMASKRPPRGEYAPGQHWYYNNWDFNALGTIFEQVSGLGIFEAFKEWIAGPIGMEDFSLDECQYVNGEASIHAAYPFRLSARDMARFGLLFCRQGKWGEQRVISPEWVQRSVRRYSDVPFDEWDRGGYGYMWWLEGIYGLESGREFYYSARGNRGQWIVIFPERDLVVVHRVNSDIKGLAVEAKQFGELLSDILAAQPEVSAA